MSEGVSTVRQRVWQAFGDPELPTLASKVVQNYITCQTCISVLSFVLSTLPALDPDWHPEGGRRDALKTLWLAEGICSNAVFTIDYCCRLYGAANRLEFLRSWSNNLDVAVVMPFYIEILISAVRDTWQ